MVICIPPVSMLQAATSWFAKVISIGLVHRPARCPLVVRQNAFASVHHITSYIDTFEGIARAKQTPVSVLQGTICLYAACQ